MAQVTGAVHFESVQAPITPVMAAVRFSSALADALMGSVVAHFQWREETLARACAVGTRPLARTQITRGLAERGVDKQDLAERGDGLADQACG